MTNKNNRSKRKVFKKTSKRPPKPSKREKAHGPPKLAGKQAKAPAAATIKEATDSSTKIIQENAGFKIEIDGIDGETTLGDLIVVFPRTREVLQKHGLRLDVEDAGDIYMTLDAFAALRGVKRETLIEELEEASKALPPPPPQPISQLASPPTT